MTVLFDSGVGLFDAATGLFDDSGIVNASVTLTGAEVTASVGTVTSNGTRSETVSVTGAAVTMSLGAVTATSDTVKAGRSKRAGKFIPYVYNGYTPPPEVKHAHAICIGAEATATVAAISAVGTIHIDGRASCKSIKVTSAATSIRAWGVINPTEEEWQLLLAA